MEIYRDTIADQLATAMIRRCREFRTPQVVRIVGLPACGKSSLARALASKLRGRKRESVVFEDAFELQLSREERYERALSGIDYESFDLTSLLNGLSALLEGDPTEVHPYFHGTGRSEGNPMLLQPADIVILDGFAWQHPVFNVLLEAIVIQ